MKLVLASNSPRRKEILSKLGLSFEIIPAQSEEKINTEIDAQTAVLRVAKSKAEEVFSQNKDKVVVGADTVVVLDNTVLGKPKDEKDAFDMLKMLSGKTHKVMTGVYVCSKKKSAGFTSVTEVKFYDLSDEEIKAYVDTKDPLDKAGAYGIQSKGLSLVEKINGDYYNVMGFPAAEFLRFLRTF